MTTNELLLMLYTKGFRDQLANKSNIHLIIDAYLTGKFHAKDGLAARTEEEILKEIYGE